jgi:hypothetical protein
MHSHFVLLSDVKDGKKYLTSMRFGARPPQDQKARHRRVFGGPVSPGAALGWLADRAIRASRSMGNDTRPSRSAVGALAGVSAPWRPAPASSAVCSNAAISSRSGGPSAPPEKARRPRTLFDDGGDEKAR